MQKKGSQLCIEKLLANSDEYFKSVKIYGDKIPLGIELNEIMLHKQPVNIGMGSNDYNHSKWKDCLTKKGLPDTTDAGKSFYTKYYENNNKLGPNVAIYCKTPTLDDSDSSNLKTKDIGILSVSAYAFDSEDQPDRKYFMNGQKFKEDKKMEYEGRIRSIFEKILRCAKDNDYKSIYIDGPGCGAFAGPDSEYVIKVYNKFFNEYKKKLNKNGIRLINGYKENPKLFPNKNYNKLNCFTKEWKKNFGEPEKVLFINNWDPHSLPGNGNNADSSVDGGYGRNAPISIIGCASINEHLLKPENYIQI